MRSRQVLCLGLKLLAVSMLLTLGSTFANTVTSNGTNGSWSLGSTWIGGMAPNILGGDDVIIVAGDNVTIDIPNAACSTLQVNPPSGSLTNATITFNATNSGLTVANAVTLGGGSFGQGTIKMLAGGSLVCNDLVVGAGFDGGSNYSAGTVQINNPTFLPPFAGPSTFHNLVVGTATLNSNIMTTSTFQVLAGTTLTNSTPAKSITSTGLVTLDGAYSVGSSGAPSAFNGGLTISATGSFSDASTGNSYTFNGSGLNVNGGMFSDTGNSSFTISSGGLTVAAGSIFSAGAGTGGFTFDTGPQSIGGTGLITLHAVVVTGTTLTNTGNLTVSSSLGGTGTFAQGAFAFFTFSGASVGITTFDPSAPGNTVTFNGAGSPVIPSIFITYDILNINSPATLASASSNFTVNTSFNIGNSAGFNGGSSIITLSGGFTVSPTGTFTPASSEIMFNGAGPQAISASNFQAVLFSGPGPKLFTGPATFNGGSNIAPGSFVSIPAGIMTVNGPFTNNGQLTVNNLNCVASSFTNLAGSVLNVLGTITGAPTFPGANNFVNFMAAGAQTVPVLPYLNMSVGGGNTKSPAGALTINGMFNIGPLTTFDAGAVFTHTLKGNFSNFGTFNGNTATLVLSGAAPQTLTGPTAFTNLTINNPANVLLGSNQSVNTNLTFMQGKISTGPFTLNITPAAVINGVSATSYVATNGGGALSKTLNPGATSFTFPIGDLTTMAPVTVANLNITAAGDLGASTTPLLDPQFALAGLDPINNVKRFWTLSTPNSFGATFDATFNFALGDLVGAPATSFVVRQFNGTTWSAPPNGVETGLSGTVTGVNSSVLGDFQIGLSLTDTPPVINSFTASLDGTSATLVSEVLTGVEVTYTATATSLAPLTYIFDFADGSTPKVVISSTGSASVLHDFKAGGAFTATLTVTDGFSPPPLPQTLQITADAPSSSGAGIQNVASLNPAFTTVTSFDGVAITVTSSNGGVITLSIDVLGLISRDNPPIVSTDFNGIGGRSGDSQPGSTPTHQFKAGVDGPGVNVAVITVKDSSGKILGRGRKTIAVSSKEVSAPMKFTYDATSQSIAKPSISGSFTFNRNGTGADSRGLTKPDKVTVGGTFVMPEGVDLTQPQDFQFAIGNIIDEVTMLPNGKSKAVGALKNIQKVQITYPKLTKDQMKSTPTKATAKFALTMSNNGLSAAGFESDGITGTLNTGEAVKKPLTRVLQVAMVFAGETYQIAPIVKFTLASDKMSGTMTARSGH